MAVSPGFFIFPIMPSLLGLCPTNVAPPLPFFAANCTDDLTDVYDGVLGPNEVIAARLKHTNFKPFSDGWHVDLLKLYFSGVPYQNSVLTCAPKDLIGEST